MHFLVFLLKLLLLIALIPPVVGTLLLAYEHGEHIRLTRQGLLAFLRDWLCHILLGPLLLTGLWDGQARESQDGDIETPVLLLHGYGLNRGSLRLLVARLRRDGWKWVHAINSQPRSAPIPELASHLSREVERLCRVSGSSRVDIVAHSTGGVIASWYISNLDGDARVRRLVTLGSPLAGTRVSVFGYRRQAEDLRPGSEVLASLDPGRVPTTSLCSDRDYMVLPRASARPPGVRVARFKHLGHIGMLFDRLAYRTIVCALRAADASMPAPERTPSPPSVPG
jgi:pimeloyl-ACP methyl ester carboxylesterase